MSSLLSLLKELYIQAETTSSGDLLMLQTLCLKWHVAKLCRVLVVEVILVSFHDQDHNTGSGMRYTACSCTTVCTAGKLCQHTVYYVYVPDSETG